MCIWNILHCVCFVSVVLYTSLFQLPYNYISCPKLNLTGNSNKLKNKMEALGNETIKA